MDGSKPADGEHHRALNSVVLALQIALQSRSLD